MWQARQPLAAVPAEDAAVASVFVAAAAAGASAAAVASDARRV